MYKFKVCDHETWTPIEYCETYEEGLAIIAQFEQDDKNDGIFEPDFYEIVPIE